MGTNPLAPRPIKPHGSQDADAQGPAARCSVWGWPSQASRLSPFPSNLQNGRYHRGLCCSSPAARKASRAVPEETATWLNPGTSQLLVGSCRQAATQPFPPEARSLPLPQSACAVASSQQDELGTPVRPWEAPIPGALHRQAAGSASPMRGQPLHFAAFCFAQQGKPRHVSLFQHLKRR